MGYCIESAVNLTIDGIESHELENDVMEIIDSTLETLRETEFFIKMGYKSSFIKDLSFYTNFLDSEFTDHPKLGRLYKFKGSFDLNDYIYDEDCYVGSPFEILELFFFGFYLSKKLEGKKVELGIGDAGFFWTNLTLLNGKIVEITCEKGDDEDCDDWGFKTNKTEIKRFYKCFQYSLSELK